MRTTLALGQVLEIPAERALYTNLALLSGQVIYRVGDNAFNDATDIKLTELVPTDTVFVGNSQATVYVKAIQASEIQYRRE